MWFGGITKSKTGHFAINKTVTKDSIKYSSHLSRIMNPPPKKHPITPSKWGGGMPHNTPTPTPTLHPSTLPAPLWQQATDKALNDSIDLHFEQVKVALNQQQECNAKFDARIGSLEITTQSMDTKWTYSLHKWITTILQLINYLAYHLPLQTLCFNLGKCLISKCIRSIFTMPNPHKFTDHSGMKKFCHPHTTHITNTS